MKLKSLHMAMLGAVLAVTVPVIAGPPASSVKGLWKLTIEDNFDGTAVNTDYWSITDECAYSICRHPENVSVSGGSLLLTTLEANHLVDPPEVSYTTGRINSLFTYDGGYVELAMRAAGDSGIQSSAFAIGDGNIMAEVARMWEPDSDDGLTSWNYFNSLGGTYPVANEFGPADPFPGSMDLSAGLNAYTLRWTDANELIWGVNGVETVRSQVPLGIGSEPIGISFGSATRNDEFGITRDPIGTAMEVDYFRLYEKRDICLGCDSFDYEAGSLDGQTGGRGWAGPWAVTSGSVDVEGSGESLGITGISLPEPKGDRMVCISDDIGIRGLSTPIPMASDGTYYVSILVKKDDAGSFEVGFERFSDGLIRWFSGVDANEGVYAGVQGATTAANAFPVGETALFVAKIQTVASGNDLAQVAFFADGDPIPGGDASVDWIASQAGNSGLQLDALYIEVFSGNVEVDEIRVGPTLADVVLPSGAPTAVESFDYDASALDGQSGGTGWSAAWLATVALSNDNVSLEYPATPSTESLLGRGDKLVLSDGVAERPIVDSFSLAEDNTYFMSFLANKSAAGELLVEATDASGNSRWKVGLRGANEVLGGVTGIVSSEDGAASMGGSLEYPPAVMLTTNGSRIEQNGPGSAKRSVSEPVPANSTSGEQAWLSFLARKTSDGTFAVRFARSSDDAARWSVEVDADGTVRSRIDNPTDSVPGVFPNDETVLVITQFIGDSTGNDMARVVVLGQGDSLPANAGDITWDAEVTRSTSVTMDELVVEVFNGLIELDEFRYGSTYESVTSSELGLHDYDGMDYPGGAISGPWTGNIEVAGSVSQSLEYPSTTPALTLTSDGGKIDHSGAGSAKIELPQTVLSESPWTRWISFLARKDAAGQFAVRTARSDGAARWNTEVSADGTVRADIFAGTDSAPGVFPNDETVMVVTRFTGDSSGADKVDVLVLGEGDTLPADEGDLDTNGLWTVSHVESTSVTMHDLVIDVLAGHVEIDEVRYGNDYESVTTAHVGWAFLTDSFDYPGGELGNNEGWTGDLNIAGPSGGFSNETVLVLSMFQARKAGTDDDRVFVKVFRSVQDLPTAPSAITSWDVVASAASSIFMSNVRISATGGSDAAIDELHIGTTYQSVLDYAVPGDCDEDGDVDIDDYTTCFEPCLAGPGVTVDDACDAADIDGDRDVDLADFARLQSMFVQ